MFWVLLSPSKHLGIEMFQEMNMPVHLRDMAIFCLKIASLA
jgi:hypothetical protein